MKTEELEIEMNRIQTFLGDDYEVTACNGVITVDKKENVKYIGWEHGTVSNHVYFIFDFKKQAINLPDVGIHLYNSLKWYLKNNY